MRAELLGEKECLYTVTVRIVTALNKAHSLHSPGVMREESRLGLSKELK